MFQYWEMQIEFEEEPEALLKRLSDELMEAWESKDHILFEIRDDSVKSTWNYRRNYHPDEEERSIQEHSDFIDAIYSNSLEKFFSFFFGDDYSWRKLPVGPAYELRYEGDSEYDDYGPSSEHDILTFFGKFCTPSKTFMETHILEDDHLPSRSYLTRGEEGHVRWAWRECIISWPDPPK